MGLEKDFELGALPHEGVRARLQALMRELQVSSSPRDKQQTQGRIDAHLYVVALLATGSPLPQLVPHECLMMHDTLSWLPSYDMGAVIREIVIEQNHSAKSVMAKIVQYCLPYIKHNRLNFPDFHTLSHPELVAMVQIIAATCLGAYEHCQRKCTWQMRVSLFWLFWHILHTSNAQDMFIFCKTHMSLMRLCIIEYFIFFLQEYMPSELVFMDRILGLTAGVHHVFRQFTLIVDSFRQQALQDTQLDMTTINSRAQTCIDKCNRLCKGKSKCVNKSISATQHKYDPGLAIRSMHMPRMPSTLHVHCYDNTITHDEAVQIVSFQHRIQIHALPYTMQRAQAAAVAHHAQHSTMTTYQSTFMYYCLRCQQHSSSTIASAKMRVRDSHVYCADCNCRDSIVKIQTVGRLVSIFGNVFYYCVCCKQVHVYQSGTCDVETCSRVRPACHKPTNTSVCMVCQRNTNSTPLQVLDDELGLTQTLSLCPNHRPPAHEHHVVQNLQALIYYISAGIRRVYGRIK